MNAPSRRKPITLDRLGPQWSYGPDRYYVDNGNLDAALTIIYSAGLAAHPVHSKALQALDHPNIRIIGFPIPGGFGSPAEFPMVPQYIVQKRLDVLKQIAPDTPHYYIGVSAGGALNYSTAALDPQWAGSWQVNSVGSPPVRKHILAFLQRMNHHEREQALEKFDAALEAGEDTVELSVDGRFFIATAWDFARSIFVMDGTPIDIARGTGRFTSYYTLDRQAAIAASHMCARIKTAKAMPLLRAKREQSGNPVLCFRGDRDTVCTESVFRAQVDALGLADHETFVIRDAGHQWLGAFGLSAQFTTVRVRNAFLQEAEAIQRDGWPTPERRTEAWRQFCESLSHDGQARSSMYAELEREGLMPREPAFDSLADSQVLNLTIA